MRAVRAVSLGSRKVEEGVLPGMSWRYGTLSGWVDRICTYQIFFTLHPIRLWCLWYSPSLNPYKYHMANRNMRHLTNSQTIKPPSNRI